MKSFFIKFLVAFIVATNFTLAQTNLSYQLKVGDQFKVTQHATQDIEQDMDGSKHKMSNLIEGDFTFTVQHVTDSLYTIKFKFDRFKMVSTSNLSGVLISVDTKDAVFDDDIEGKIFAQLLVTDLKMNMYRNGKIKTITGSKRLIENMVNAAGDFDEFTRDLMKESMAKEFSNKSLAKSFEQMTYLYSSKAVNVNDHWKNEFQGELSSHNTWTFKGIENDNVIIDGASTILFKNENTDVEMNLIGNMTSSVVTSLSTGFVKTMTTHSFAKGYSVMHTMNDIKIPTTITSNITIKIEKHVQ